MGTQKETYLGGCKDASDDSQTQLRTRIRKDAGADADIDA